MAKAKLKLLGNKIAVQVITEKETQSGIVLPSTIKKERPKEGTVKYVGPGKKLENGKYETMEVKVGDHIVFGGWADPVKVDDEEYYVVSEDDVQFIIE